jgi:hypothetical protein
MAILMRATIPGMTKEIYHHMAEKLLPQLRTQKGFIAHCGYSIAGGWEVSEIWESPEAHEIWQKTTIIPAMQAGGIIPPIITIIPAEKIVTK